MFIGLKMAVGTKCIVGSNITSEKVILSRIIKKRSTRIQSQHESPESPGNTRCHYPPQCQTPWESPSPYYQVFYTPTPPVQSSRANDSGPVYIKGRQVCREWRCDVQTCQPWPLGYWRKSLHLHLAAPKVDLWRKRNSSH